MADYKARGLEFGKKPKVNEEAKGEVEPKGGEKAEKGKKKHRRPHEIHLRHAAGGFIAKHLHKPEGEMGPGQESTEHLIPAAHEGDLDGLHAHLEDHWGSPNQGESEMGENTIHGAAGSPVGAEAQGGA